MGSASLDEPPTDISDPHYMVQLAFDDQESQRIYGTDVNTVAGEADIDVSECETPSYDIHLPDAMTRTVMSVSPDPL